MVCPKCQFDNPIGMKFCGNCGTQLQAALLPPLDERRVVTALFGDVSGFTSMSESLDPEEVKEIMNRCLSRLAEVAREFGGTVDKFGGDSILAYFGYPVAHEDDPERAVRTGLTMQEVMSEFSDELVQRGYRRLQMRVGVNTGLVLAGQIGSASHQESTIMGDTVNTASRLQGQTTPGRIGVSESTWRATKHVFDFDAGREVQVKGKAEPLKLYEVIGIRSERASLRGLEGKGLSAPLIGRSREMQELLTCYAEAVAGRQSVLATVWGAAGSGKSRLIADFSAMLASEQPAPTVLRGRCLPFGQGSITYWPLGEMVKQECGILESDALAEVERKLTAGIEAMLIKAEGNARHNEVERLVTHIAATMNWGFVGNRLMGMGEASRREERLAAWRRFFSLKAALNPLVLFFEDIHWAEATMLDVIEQLTERLDDVPVLILCASRPELRESRANWGNKCGMTSITLHPLDEQESITLVNSLLIIDELPEVVRDLIVQRAEGNPFYVEEIIRLLVEDKKIEQRTGHWVAVEGIEQTVLVPENVNYLLSARIDRLAVEQKRVLQEASVMGREFWGGAVNNMLNNQLTAPKIAQSLVELVEKEMVEWVHPSSFIGEDEYSFRHVLTHDVAYEMLPHRERSKKHQLAAQWLERSAGDRVGEYVERIAYHYQQAIRFAERAAALPGTNNMDDVRTKAVHYLVMAGEKNMELQDFLKAQQLLANAIALGTEGDSTVAIDLHLKYGKVNFFTGNYDEAEQSLQQAMLLNERVHNPAFDAEALWYMAELNRHRATYELAVPLYTKLISLYQGLGDSDGQARALINLALLQLLYTQNNERAAQLAQQAHELAQARCSPLVQIQAMQLLAVIYNDVFGNLSAAERISYQLLNTLDGLDDRLQLCTTLLNLALICYDEGKYADSANYSRQSIDIAKELGYRVVEMKASNSLAHALLALGQPDEATGYLHRALEISAALDEREVLPEIRRGLAEMHLALGEQDAALEQAEIACAVVLPEDTYSQATTQCTLGRVLAAQRRASDAEAAFRRSLATLECTAYLPTLAYTCESYATFLAGNGRDKEAASLSQRAAELRQRIANPEPSDTYLLDELNIGDAASLNLVRMGEL